MYLDSVLNYCSARTTINNYLVRWCLLLFHFSLEANVRANLVPEILRTPEEHVLNVGPSANFSSLLIHYHVLQHALWDLTFPPPF